MAINETYMRTPLPPLACMHAWSMGHSHCRTRGLNIFSGAEREEDGGSFCWELSKQRIITTFINQYGTKLYPTDTSVLLPVGEKHMAAFLGFVLRLPRTCKSVKNGKFHLVVGSLVFGFAR